MSRALLAFVAWIFANQPRGLTWIAEYAKRGYPVIQQGRIDEDAHYYLDTQKDFGYMIELGNAGKIRPAERTFP